MKKYLIVIVTMVLFSGRNSAQQLSPFVLSTSGGFYNNDSGMLSFTSGEMAAVETYTSPSVILTQGFQQVWDIGTYIPDQLKQDLAFRIYPNPSDGQINLVTDTEANEKIDVKISDVLGNIILLTSYSPPHKFHVEPIDLTHVAQGIYIVVITLSEHNYRNAYHFVKKIHLVK